MRLVLNIAKSRVKGYYRRSKSGSQVFVREHTDKRTKKTAFSTGNVDREMNTLTPKDVSEVEELYKVAPKKLEIFNKILDNLSKKIGAEKPPLSQMKKKETAISKIDRKRRVDGRADYGAKDLGDLVRATIFPKKWTDAATIVQELKRTYPIVNVESFVSKPGANWGYRGIHIDIEDGEGFKKELQVMKPDYWDVKHQAHEIYSKWRDVKYADATPQQKAEFMQDMEKSNQLYNGYFSKQPGIDSVDSAVLSAVH